MPPPSPVPFPPLSQEFTFSVTAKPIPSAVFYLEASDYVHCEKEGSANRKIDTPISTRLAFLKKNKVYFFPQKNANLKKNPKFYYSLWLGKNTCSYIYIYIYTKCINIFSLHIFDFSKNKWTGFSRSARKNGLFSIARFLYSWQKIFTNKNIFSKCDLHVLFITFFSKMYNEK